MLAPGQSHRVRDRECLAGAEGRRQILQAAKVGSQIDDRQAVIARQLRNTGNPQLPFNVVDVGEVVDRVVGAAVKDEAAIEALSPVRALFCLVLSLLLLAILRATSATSKETKRSRRLRSKAVVEADEHAVGAAGRR